MTARDELREKIADFMADRDGFNWDFYKDNENSKGENGEEIRRFLSNYRKYADSILSLDPLPLLLSLYDMVGKDLEALIEKVKETQGKCTECDGKGIKSYSGRASDGFDKCETCNGSGRTIQINRLAVLDNEQALPKYEFGWPYISRVQQDMLQAGFRKVKG